MKRNDWHAFKKRSESLFREVKVDYKNTWGFQEQPNTCWNKGLPLPEIQQLQKHFGFTFPDDYCKMLQVLNGFDTPAISVDPEGVREPVYRRRCYRYPDDLESTTRLIQEANEFKQYAEEALRDSGFQDDEIEGFVPLYGHRVLAVLKDKNKSPVLSIWGNDIIVYGNNLFEYWCNEFHIPHETGNRI